MSYPRFLFAAALCVVLFAPPPDLHASLVTDNDVIAISTTTVGSGNGTLNLRLLTQSGSKIQNSSGTFNGDNGNNSLPNGSGTSSFAESYVTTMGEIRAFYELNFPASREEVRQ
ncbi:MAG: hypothetical protein KDA61_02630 [Planctomycetales bacterium]|nr:hypothetical protein [Planctomycetales bacterium]